jgi:signal transduction histidine kinase
MRVFPPYRALRNLSLRTQLLMIMLSLLLLSVSALFILHYYSERRLMSQVREYTDDLSTALDIAQKITKDKEQPATEGDPQAVLDAYAAKLRQLGVKAVSIADEEEVRASTDPGNVGKKIVTKKKKRGPREYVIKGTLGEAEGPPGSQRTSEFTIPIVVGDRLVGLIVITQILDNFSDLSRSSFMRQLATTLAVFAVGILLSLYLSSSFTRPLGDLSEAARRVAAGDLEVQVPSAGRDAIATLSRTFNEMVNRLRENRRLEERLHFAERSTALGRLASAVAHEIRNPLNFINLSIDHVRERLHPEDPRQKEDFDRILGSVKSEISRLNRLVGDFLSFGKPMRLHPRACSLERVLHEVAALVDHKAKDQSISLAFAAEPGLPEVVADPELLKTCFLNLLINAVDAMPQGGELKVSLTKTGTRPEEIVIAVSDTGQGMSPEDVRTAFEPYFSTKETGLGLGLALTHKIVTDHGGTIVLESTLGQGTTATIKLPLVTERAHAEVVA